LAANPEIDAVSDTPQGRAKNRRVELDIIQAK
jgi:outer membrane protein OmpA-like peptidoglycan-associated protein